jgi:hypothetical protein
MKPTKQQFSHLRAIGAVALLLGSSGARAEEFHVDTVNELATALTTAAGNGMDNTIYLARQDPPNARYQGTFNFNSAGGGNLTIQAEPGVTNTDIILDANGGGNDLNLVNTGVGNITVRGITFLRNSGSPNIAALRISAAAGAIVVEGCRFFATGSGMGMEIVRGTSLTVTNCIVTGGNGTGVSISGVAGNVNVRNCVVSTNYSNVGGRGAGIDVSAAGSLHVSGSSILGNNSGNGGGVYSRSTPTTLLTNNAIMGNSGGGAVVQSGTALIYGNTFASNSVSGQGGGVWCVNIATLSGNTFRGNYSSGDGGAGYFGNFGSQVVISGNNFVGNSSGVGGGGALSCNSVVGTISSNNFTGNSCHYRGGGIKCVLQGDGTLSLVGNTFRSNVDRNGYGGGADCEESLRGTLTLSNNTFVANTATSSSGGGAYCVARNLTLSGNVFRQNIAGFAGGFASGGSSVVLVNNLVARNSQTQPAPSSGGGFTTGGSSDLFMINNTIFGNTANGNGGGVAFYVNGTVEVYNVYNNIIWGNSATGDGADVWLAGTGREKIFRHNNVHGMYGVWDIADNLLDVDPQFFDAVNGDFHIRSTSPCKEAGTNGVPSLPYLDLDGGPRIAGGTVDLGCYEFSTDATHPADVNGNFVLTTAEFTDYAAAWKTGLIWSNAPPLIPADYLTRAGYLMTNGGTYFNDGSARPVNWKIAP